MFSNTSAMTVSDGASDANAGSKLVSAVVRSVRSTRGGSAAPAGTAKANASRAKTMRNEALIHAILIHVSTQALAP
jgi:hypothetical protein